VGTCHSRGILTEGPPALASWQRGHQPCFVHMSGTWGGKKGQAAEQSEVDRSALEKGSQSGQLSCCALAVSPHS
jgi:hypothetical protein